MLILLLVSSIGYSIVHRSLINISREFAFSQDLIRVLSLSNLVVISLITLSTGSSAVVWVFIGILLLSLKLIPRLLRVFLLNRLRKALIPFLDAIILSLQMGKSFRSCLYSAIEIQDGWVKHQLLEIYQSMSLAENVIAAKSALLADLQKEFRLIERSQTRCLEQVKSLRRELKLLDSFRRRSGQITQQIKMQALIVTALFLSLLIFVVRQFGFFEHRFLVFFASGTFLIGLIWIFFVGKRMKWKV